MICVTTRFRLRHCWALLPMYATYYRMRHDLKIAPGLIRYAFLLQSPVACCTLSVWKSESALAAFSNVPSHINAVRRAKRWRHQMTTPRLLTPEGMAVAWFGAASAAASRG